MFLSIAKDADLETCRHPAHHIPDLLLRNPKQHPRCLTTAPVRTQVTNPEVHIPIVRNPIWQSVDLLSFPTLTCSRRISVRCFAESPGPIHGLDYSRNGLLCTLEPASENECEIKLQDITLQTPMPAYFNTGVVHSMSLSQLEPAVLVGQAKSSPVLVEANGDLRQKTAVRTDAAVLYSSFDSISKSCLATSDILNVVHVWDMRATHSPSWSCKGSRVEAIRIAGHALYGACMNQVAMWDIRVASSKGPLNSYKPAGFRPFGLALEECWGTVISVGYLSPARNGCKGGIAIWNPGGSARFMEIPDVTIRAWPIASEGGVLVEGDRDLFVLGGSQSRPRFGGYPMEI